MARIQSETASTMGDDARAGHGAVFCSRCRRSGPSHHPIFREWWRESPKGGDFYCMGPSLDRLIVQVSTADGTTEDKRCATFSIKNEDHTLGNALRHVIMKKYARPTCLTLSVGPPAIDVLRKGLDDLQSMMEILLKKFDAAVQGGDYEHYPDVEI
ncbi:DNA-directed RNA polymerases I and III subunit RPAC2-like protein [Paramicrosporidium saccamoebae]|uniref:DNA-directed RNA polymerases I and III subunit RPAC2-like protein n=1 Tax=Paramicrosporidium saccamoebae TaxID=1246581 RepID=A0A2H9TND8_9FUNG|nr:DNA-directed RNA polymerases I and III subunit RPAC2-like protein [Paramicrosporidium saccamoebae]